MYLDLNTPMITLVIAISTTNTTVVRYLKLVLLLTPQFLSNPMLYHMTHRGQHLTPAATGDTHSHTLLPLGSVRTSVRGTRQCSG
jgi:hypothetical protein